MFKDIEQQYNFAYPKLYHQLYADQMLDEFTQGIEKKIKWIQPLLLMGIGFLIVSMYLILLLPTLTMIGGN